jgi:hypothetical protein
MRAQLGSRGDELDDPVHVVLAEPGHHLFRHGVDVVGGGHEKLAKVPSGKDGHAVVEHPTKVIYATFAYLGQRLEPFRLVDVIEHAELVVRPERRRPPALVMGHELIPPWGCPQPMAAYSEDHGSRKSA